MKGMIDWYSLTWFLKYDAAKMVLTVYYLFYIIIHDTTIDLKEAVMKKQTWGLNESWLAVESSSAFDFEAWQI